MNFTALIQALAPLLISLLQAAQNWQTPTAPAPSEPAVVSPNEAIKALQQFLNVAMQLNPPLTVDGWVGPKTNQAIMDGLAKLKGMGIG